MDNKILTIDSATTAYDAAKIMNDYDTGYVLVQNNKTVIGIITERDFMRVITKERAAPQDVTVYQMMSKPVKTIQGEASVTEAAVVMLENRIRRLPVTDGDKFVGIVTYLDINRLVTHLLVEKQTIELL